MSQFLHSYVCERFIFFQDWSAYSAAGKYVDRSWEYINCSQNENVEIGTEAAQFPEKEYVNVIFVAVYLWLLKVGGQGHFSSQMVKGDMASGHGCISTQGKIDPGETEQTADPQSVIPYVVFKKRH